MSKNVVISKKNKRDRYKFFIKISLVVFSVVLIAGCNSKNKKSAMELNTRIAAEQEPYQIRLWQGGGFTGLTSGFTLSSNGDVTRWQRFPGQPDSILWKGAGNLAEIQKLKTQLIESGALETKSTETGNMTAGINYETKDNKYTWTWTKSDSENDIPELFKDWYQKATIFCQSLQGKN